MTIEQYTQGYPFIRQMLNEGEFSLERPDHHPERFLGAHIREVFRRCAVIGLPELMTAAVLHDLCKHQMPNEGTRGGLRTIEGTNGETFTYHSNPDHPEQAGELIQTNPEVKRFILDKGADFETVFVLVTMHMKYKTVCSGIVRRSKLVKFYNEYKKYIPLMEIFRHMDTMTTEMF